MFGLILIICMALAQAQTDLDIKFLTSYLKNDPFPKVLTTFLCWGKGPLLDLSKQLYQENLRLANFDPKKFAPNENHDSTEALTPILRDIPHFLPSQHNFYLLDFDCNGSKQILTIANTAKMFSKPFRWLILTKNQSQVENFLEIISILLDSNVVLALRQSSSFLLKDQYKMDEQSSLKSKYMNVWTEEKGLANKTLRVISRERRDLEGKFINSSVYFPGNNSVDHVWDYREKHVNTVSKVNFIILNLELDYLNATRGFIFTNTWGYPIPNSTMYNGIVGQLQTGAAELGMTVFLTPDRFDVLSYLTLFISTRPVFIFKKPPLSYVSNIFTLPFSRMVWISSFCLLVLIILILYLIVHFEINFSPKGTSGLEDNLSDITLMTVGYMCIQGSTKEPVGSGGRTAILFGSIALMFLYVSYSANIVSLLQSTTETINTLEDLLESGLKLGTEDTVYNRYFFPRNTEKIRKQIYTKKISPPGEEPHFLHIDHGVQKLRDGFYAFHCERGVGYKIISDTFYEEEKCGLQEIGNYIQVVDPWYTIRKNSTIEEIVRVGTCKIREYGLNSRELLRWYAKKPECITGGSNFGSVGIIDVYGAFLSLIAGIILSIMILLLEIVMNYKCKCQTK